jgi:rhamnosyltransferase subunit B
LDDPETVLVGSMLSWGVRLVQDARGLRGATLHLSPLCIPSAIAPPVLPGVGDLSWLPTWAMRPFQWAGERLVLDRWVAPRLNRFRATLGLPPVRRTLSRWMHSPDLVIGAWPDWFAPRQRDWPPCAVTTGFPVFDDGGATLDDALAAFVDAGPAPIGITAGSAMAHGAAFFARALDACRVAGHRAVLVTAFPDDLPSPLPASAHAVAYTPFSALLPRLAALIHHGGIGTSAQCLTAGIPQLVAPFAHDQFDNAARLRRLGVSTTLDRSASIDAWAAAIRARCDVSVGDGRDAVRSCSDRLAAAEPAAIAIARRLEELARRAHRPTGRHHEEP